jgi:ABC-type ATPase involved in cell division
LYARKIDEKSRGRLERGRVYQLRPSGGLSRHNKKVGMKMLSYEKKMDLAHKFVADCNISEVDRDDIPVYLVEDIGVVVAAYAKDLEGLEDVYDNSPSEDIDRAVKAAFSEDVGKFLDRHGIPWK